MALLADEVDVENARRALDGYVPYAETIEQAGARRNIPQKTMFGVFQENHDPPLESLVEGLTED